MINIEPTHQNYLDLKKMCDDPLIFVAVRAKSIWVSNNKVAPQPIAAELIPPLIPLNNSTVVITPPDATIGSPLEPQIEPVSPLINTPYHIYYNENCNKNINSITKSPPSDYTATSETKKINGILYTKYSLKPGIIGRCYMLYLTEETIIGEKSGAVGNLFFIRTRPNVSILNPTQEEFGFITKDSFDVFFVSE